MPIESPSTAVRTAAVGRSEGREGPPNARRPRRRPASRRPRADRLAPYILVAPAVLIIAGLRLYPLALGVNFSFTGDGERNGQVVGLDNYAAPCGRS